MRAFEHRSATTVEEALSFLGRDGKGQIIAGGTDLLGEMKRGIIAPERLVDIKPIPGLGAIEDAHEDGLRIGATARLAALCESDLVRRRTPLLAQAARAAASPQLRNMGTLAGNLCQRPRCWYYRGDFPCLRKGGRRCFAVSGDNRYHAILGGGPCHIVHPSDTAPALLALDAELDIAGPDETRHVPLRSFFVGPQTDPHRENLLEPDELITQIRVPAPAAGARGIYLKLRERQVWAFALVSVAVQLTMEDHRCREARIVLGGVAPVPWRSEAAENAIEGTAVDVRDRDRAAAAAVAEARPLRDNAYKVTLARNLVAQALAAVTDAGSFSASAA
jgi:xanthine dehydrogenase YagS FAD-binding subunit